MWLTNTNNPIVADGFFGPITHSAVLEFQSKHGLSKDATVDPNTWRAIANALNVKVYNNIRMFDLI